MFYLILMPTPPAFASTKACWSFCFCSFACRVTGVTLPSRKTLRSRISAPRFSASQLCTWCWFWNKTLADSWWKLIDGIHYRGAITGWNSREVMPFLPKPGSAAWSAPRMSGHVNAPIQDKTSIWRCLWQCVTASDIDHAVVQPGCDTSL